VIESQLAEMIRHRSANWYTIAGVAVLATIAFIQLLGMMLGNL
jgi:hypothetical protein